MSDDILELRHSISDGSVPGSSSSSSSSKRPSIPAPVFIKNKPVSIPKLKEKEKDSSSIDERIQKRSALFVKINNYLTSPTLAPHISESIRAPSESASMETLEATYKQILDSIRSNYKRMMVDTMFEEGLGGMEMILTQFLQIDGAIGIAQAAISEKSLFQQELEEISIEMDASLVPGPKMRLGGKLLKFLGEYIRGHAAQMEKNSNQKASDEQQEEIRTSRAL